MRHVRLYSWLLNSPESECSIRPARFGPAYARNVPRLVGSVSRIDYNRSRGETCTMKKPSKTAAELEASIKVEIEDICDWPTDITISVQPDGDSWTAKVMQEGSVDDADRREMVEQIAARLKAEYDLKG